MTPIFVALTILVFLIADVVVRRHRAKKKEHEDVFITDIGLTMADGGKKISDSK